jgi:uncharacterized protein (TIGR03086 family)
MDVRELDRRAVRGSVEVAERVTAGDLGRATPCAGWTVADLLAHMTAQHRGFTAAARGHGADPKVWEVRSLVRGDGAGSGVGEVRSAAAARGDGAGPGVGGVRALVAARGAEARFVQVEAVAEYLEAAEGVLGAFAEEGVLERVFELPEFGDGAAFRGERAVGFHLIDYVVHGWDLARAIGVAYAPESELVEAVWPIARAVPDGGSRLAPGAAFRPGLAVSEDAPLFERVLAVLGRAPGVW